MPIKHASRRMVKAACNLPWAIEEGTLGTILEIMQLRADGYRFSKDEIKARIQIKRAGGQYRDDDEDDDDDEDYGPQFRDGISILPLQGVLAPKMNLFMQVSGGTSTQQFAGWFQKAMDDPKVKAVVLDVDSPGGAAVYNEEVAQLIRSYRGVKPIKAVATGMIASAAYYIGSAADELIVSPSTQVGSIGTYMIHGESSRADANAGITYSVIKAGANKAVGNEVEPLTAQSRAVLQERVDDLNAQFVQAVAANRNTTVENVLQSYGQGKVMLAPKSVALGMADRVGSLGQVVSELSQKMQVLVAQQLPGSSVRHDDPISESTSSPPVRKECSMLTQAIKQALVERGLISAESSDAEGMIALRSFFAARAGSMPTDEKSIVAAISAKAAEPQERIPGKVFDASEITKAERARIEDLQTRGQLLHIDQATVKAAIDEGMSVADALLQWTKQKSEANQSVSTVRLESDHNDVFAAAAVDALYHRTVPSDRARRQQNDASKPQLSQAARGLQHKSLLQIAEMSLSASGFRMANIGDTDDLIKAALGMGVGSIRIRSSFEGDGGMLRIRGDDAGFARPGDFPNILSALIGKMMDEAYDYAPTTYADWAYQLPSVADFKPKTIMAAGEFGEMPRVPDGDDFVESTIAEEASWIATDTYGDEWTLTPRMIADDDLGALQEASQDKVVSHEMTQGRLCVNLLVGNAVAGDGNNLFDYANHGNWVRTGGSGGAPTAGVPGTDQLAAMRLLLRKQKGVSNKRKLSLTLKTLLIPEDMETAVQQLLSVNVRVVPVTTATGEIFRGMVDYLVEPMLADSSTIQYYGFADKQRARSIVYCRQRGFEQMKSRLYFNPKNNCRVLQCEGRMAAAIRNWRGVVRNDGVA